ncbi:MAG: DUF4398 domain-containing protein [Methylomonas sp.]|jgi:hypothetical protein
MKLLYRSVSIPWLQAITISLSAALLLTACAGAPPTAQVAVAKAAVKNADAAGANEFAPLPFRTAEVKMEGAEQAMAAQDYPLARQLAEEAEVDAQLSAVTARTVKARKSVSQLQQDNSVLRQEIDRKTQ